MARRPCGITSTAATSATATSTPGPTARSRRRVRDPCDVFGTNDTLVAMRIVVLAVLAACGSDDPCAGIKDTCVALHVTSPTVARIDELDLDLLYGTQHAA